MSTFPCVCEICNCGRHRCPHKLRQPGPWDKCNLSEYNRHYVPHEICPVQSLKPSYKPVLGEGPLSQDTTHRTDYVAHCMEPPKSMKPSEYVKPEGEMDDVTMYRKEYGPKEACPRASAKPAPTRTVPAKFQGDTTNRDDYKAWDLPPRRLHKPDQYVPNDEKFDALPSYRRDYIPHCVEPPKSFKPGITSTLSQSKDPMAQDTDYRQSYVVHPIEPREKKPEVCLPKKRAPLDSLTMHRKEFTPKEICRQKSFKPPPHMMQTDMPLSDATTHRTDYILHDAEKPYKYEPEKYRKPDGDIDMQTTYNKEYTNLPACKSQSVKPPVSRRIPAPFSDATSYRDNYQKWDVPPARIVKRDQYQPPTDRFDDCTTSKAAYVPHEICQVSSFKPAPHMMSEQPFDDATMYRQEYTKKCQPYCPAAYLSTDERAVSPDGYIYHNEDERGHLHYRRGQIPSFQKGAVSRNASNSVEIPSTFDLHKKHDSVVLPPLVA